MPCAWAQFRFEFKKKNIAVVQLVFMKQDFLRLLYTCALSLFKFKMEL